MISIELYMELIYNNCLFRWQYVSIVENKNKIQVLLSNMQISEGILNIHWLQNRSIVN